MLEIDEIKNRFTYHTPKECQPVKYEAIRNIGKFLVMCIEDVCPDSREKALTMTKLEEVIIWANASIARNG